MPPKKAKLTETKRKEKNRQQQSARRVALQAIETETERRARLDRQNELHRLRRQMARPITSRAAIVRKAAK